MEAAKAAIELAELSFVKGKAVDSDLPARWRREAHPGAVNRCRGTEVVVRPSNGKAGPLPSSSAGYNDAKNFLLSEGWTNVVEDCDIAEIGTPPGDLEKVYATDPAPGSVVNKAAIITLRYYNSPGCP